MIVEMADQSIATQTPRYAELNNFVVPNYSSVLYCGNVCPLPKATSSHGLSEGLKGFGWRLETSCPSGPIWNFLSNTQ